MSIIAFIQELKKLDIKIDLQEGQLKISFPKGNLSDEIKKDIKDRKDEIIDFLTIASASKVISIPRVLDQASYELSHAQRRLWVLSQMRGGSTAYNMPGLYEFAGQVDRLAFRKSFDSLIERHESLRTVFSVQDGEPKQKILSLADLGFNLEEIDLRGVEDRKQLLRDYQIRDVEDTFDLENGPLLRAKLLQLEEDKYVFLFTMHHIISDGLSIDVLINDVVLLYESYCKQENNPLPALKIQYKDYASWQNAQLSNGSMNSHKKYWLNQLAGEIPVLTLAQDRRRPKVRSYDGKVIHDSYDLKLSSSLHKLSKENGVSLFMLLLTGIKTLLYRYSGQKDLIVGSPIAGREHADLEDLIGCYVNTLALRTKIEDADTFLALLKRIKESTIDAYNYQSYPFDLLVEQLSLPRDLSRNPIFDVMVVLHNVKGVMAPKQDVEESDESLVQEYLTSSKFDLTFSFVEYSKGGIDVSIEYNTDIYDGWRISGLMGHLKKIFETVVADQLLDHIKILQKEEEQSLLNYNSTAVLYPKAKVIQDLFEERIVNIGSKPALVVRDQIINYDELNRRSNRLGHYLRSGLEVKPNDLVGVLLGRSIEMITGIMGILKSGGAYLPIDPLYPEERIRYMISDSNVKVVLTDNDYLLNKSIEGCLFIDIREEHSFKEYSEENLEIINSTEDLAYVIYTSGSTGQPKGVMIQHRNVVNYISWANQYYFNDEPSYSLGLFTSLSFDLTVTSIFCSLLRGGVLAVYEEQQPIEMLAKMFGSSSTVNSVKLTPSHIDVLGELDIKGCEIKVVIVGGEPLKDSQVRILKELNPSIRIYNEYGPTEATVGCIVKEIVAENEKITIGKPISNMRVYILDDHLEMLPKGVYGEICISGDGIAKGYINKEELTATKFIDNPYEENSLMYRSGDVGCWLPDGTIDFIGRKDNQIKIRGFRVELSEIEHVISLYPEIESCVVIMQDDNFNHKNLVCYIVSKATVSEASLRSYLKLHLPDYMIPSQFITIDTIPLTINGKLDREKLPTTSDRIVIENLYTAPRNEIEQTILGIWEDLLNRERISIHDNFFEIGGYSIMLIKLFYRINATYPQAITIADLFDNPTVEEQSKLLVPKDRINEGELNVIDF